MVNNFGSLYVLIIIVGNYSNTIVVINRRKQTYVSMFWYEYEGHKCDIWVL